MEWEVQSYFRIKDEWEGRQWTRQVRLLVDETQLGKGAEKVEPGKVCGAKRWPSLARADRCLKTSSPGKKTC